MRIVTSLAPHGRVDIQRAAVESWRALGARVTSLNPPVEADAVRGLFPGVAVEITTETAEALVGRPLVRIATAVRALADSPDDGPLVLLNSDIVLDPPPGWSARLAAEAAAGTVIALPRIDVDEPAARAAGPFDKGYDGMVLPTAFARAVPRAPFCFGMPFWDFWLPLLALLQGRTVAIAEIPALYHVRHAIGWGDHKVVFMHALMDAVLHTFRTAAAREPAGTAPPTALLLALVEHPYAHLIGRVRRADPDDTTAPAELARFYDRINEVVTSTIRRRASFLRAT